jgi:L-asparaginase
MLRSKEDRTYFPFDLEHLLSHFPEIDRLASDIDFYSFNPPLDSSNIGPAIWVKIAKIIRDNYEKADAFVILHGSDTMAYTGSALSFMLEGLAKPVIMTGSQLPIGEIRTDAKENLVTAMQIAAHPKASFKEVCVYFEYKLFRANRVKKVHADVFHAFNSPNFPPLAQAGVKLNFYRPTPADAYNNIPFRVQEKLETNVTVVKFFPGITPELIEAVALRPEIKGVILESYGTGNIPTDPGLINAIRKTVDAGKIVLNITQCSGGPVDMGRYTTSKMLLECGVLSGSDLTFEAALTKMMYLLGKYEDKDQVRHFLTRNIRGEMNAERAYTV